MSETSFDYEMHARLFDSVEGGPALVALFGNDAPTFHDANLLSVHLSNADDGSRLVIDCPYPNFWATRRLLVTLHMREIVDLHLDYFAGSASLLFGLYFRPATVRPERQGFVGRRFMPTDVEIDIETSFGMEGFIVARGLSVTWGEPSGVPSEKSEV